jgi:hypothetical protein
VVTVTEPGRAGQGQGPAAGDSGVVTWAESLGVAGRGALISTGVAGRGALVSDPDPANPAEHVILVCTGIYHVHLEPCRPSSSISKVGPSISLYYDIEGSQKMTSGFDIGYDMTTRYRMFLRPISNA